MIKNYAKLLRSFISRYGCLSGLLLLTGCASVITNNLQHNTPQEIKNWELDGKFSLSSESQNNTLVFHWKQDDADYLINFILPFGQGNYVLESKADQSASLLTPKKKLLVADDAVALLLQTTGWDVPMDNFSYWLRGLPIPKIKQTNMQFDEDGNITEMQQESWQVSFKRYVKVGDIVLPNKVFVKNDRVLLKLVLWNWNLKL